VTPELFLSHSLKRGTNGEELNLLTMNSSCTINFVFFKLLSILKPLTIPLAALFSQVLSGSRRRQSGRQAEAKP